MADPAADVFESAVVKSFDVVGFDLGQIAVYFDLKKAPGAHDNGVGGVIPGPAGIRIFPVRISGVGGRSVEGGIVVIEVGLVVGGMRSEAQYGLVVPGGQPDLGVTVAFRNPGLARYPYLAVLAVIVINASPIERNFDAAVHFRILDSCRRFFPAHMEDPVLAVIYYVHFAFHRIFAFAVDAGMHDFRVALTEPLSKVVRFKIVLPKDVGSGKDRASCDESQKKEFAAHFCYLVCFVLLILTKGQLICKFTNYCRRLPDTAKRIRQRSDAKAGSGTVRSSFMLCR